MLKIINNVFSDEEVRQYIDMMEPHKMHQATTYDEEGNEIIDENYRKCQRMLVESNNLANLLQERLQSYIPTLYDGQHFKYLNNMIRFIKYNHGDFFNPHVDGCYIDENDNESCFTILVYLNDDYEGGELVIYNDEEQALKPSKGSVILLEQVIVHKVNMITKGKKYVLRTDVMYTRY